MKKIVLLFVLAFIGIQASSQDEFITTWQPNWASQTIVIPTKPGLTYNYTVDWGDGTVTTGHTSNASHIYNSTAIQTIKISGVFPSFYNNDVWNNSLKTIEQWGNIAWSSMKNAFYNCTGLTTINAIDTPNLSMVTDMSYMFGKTYTFNGNIGNWDVSSVTNMEGMFYEARVFNQDIGNWNVSNVTNMRDIFKQTGAFNQNLGGWDVGNVTNAIFLQQSGLSAANYDATLIGWSNLNVKPGVIVTAWNIPWCHSAPARDILISKGWTINNQTAPNCLGPLSSQTEFNGENWSNGAPDNTKKVVFASNFTSTSNMEVGSLEIKQGVTVTIGAGTTITAQNDLAIYGDLVFESNVTGNGELGKLGPKAAIIGKATVQCYMKGKRAYRMVSPAVTTSTSIMENWQEGVHNTTIGQNQNPNPGFGTHITGSQTGANGFDATGTGSPSMFTVDVASQAFQIVPNTITNKLTVGEGYLMMIRGDRSINLNDNNASGETILRATGKLAWGDKPQMYIAPTMPENKAAFVLFGNPYQSAVDMSAVFATSTNVNKNYYFIYDPSLGDYGAYSTVDLKTGIDANRFLQPGQAGQLMALNGGKVIVDFREAYKTPGEFTSTNATGNTVVDETLIGQLYTQENYSNDGAFHDAFELRFAEENNNAVTPDDAVKPMNFYENLGIDHEGAFLSVERRSYPEAGENFTLYTNGYQHTDYVLKMEINGLDNVTIYLDDHFNGTSTLLEQGITAHSFTIDQANPESKATDRFSIRVGERLSVNDTELLAGVILYPNPMGSQLKLNNPKNIQLDTASIYDLTGRLIKTANLKGATSETSIDVSTLSSATYMVVINGEAGKISKLIVKK